MVTRALLHAQMQPGIVTPDSPIAWAFVYITGIVVLGLVLIVTVSMWDAASPDRTEILRGLGEMFRGLAEVFRWWFRRGGPPGSA
jgi:hypothetical protein